MQKRITVAIDGYSSSGKSTMARELAARTGYVYVDSGAMYRAVTLWVLRNGYVSDEGNIDKAGLLAGLPSIEISFAVQPDGSQHTLLNGEDVEREIRDMAVSNMVSPVAEIPEVRRRLTALQQSYGREKGIVMDGRDIGTTVFPDAEMKIFVDASAEERARRRMLELEQKGMPASYDEVLANIRKRDDIDTHRKESPLRQADDAFVLCNDNLTPAQQMQILLDIFKEKTAAAND